MYKCPECGEIFEEPKYETVCMEDYCGVSTLFGDRHYATFANCPKCGAAIDDERDMWDESYEEDEDDRIAYYERQGDEYVYYDSNECEIYREPA